MRTHHTEPWLVGLVVIACAVGGVGADCSPDSNGVGGSTGLAAVGISAATQGSSLVGTSNGGSGSTASTSSAVPVNGGTFAASNLTTGNAAADAIAANPRMVLPTLVNADVVPRATNNANLNGIRTNAFRSNPGRRRLSRTDDDSAFVFGFLLGMSVLSNQAAINAALANSGLRPAVDLVDCNQVVPDAVIRADIIGNFEPPRLDVSLGAVVRFEPAGLTGIRSLDGTFETAIGDVTCLWFHQPGTYAFDAASNELARGAITVIAPEP